MQFVSHLLLSFASPDSGPLARQKNCPTADEITRTVEQSREMPVYHSQDPKFKQVVTAQNTVIMQLI
jgi:hypothetical protein